MPKKDLFLICIFLQSTLNVVFMRFQSLLHLNLELLDFNNELFKDLVTYAEQLFTSAK